jgi:hypothetical protein
MDKFVKLYNNQWVQLSFTVSGYNQMDQTETQIISRVTFEGNKCNLSPKSLVRSGHPCQEDADMSSQTWIGNTKWEWHRVEMEMEIKQDDVFDFDTDEWTKGGWILERKADDVLNYMGGETVSIELLDMEDEEVKKLLMPPPRAKAPCRRTSSTNFKF